MLPLSSNYCAVRKIGDAPNETAQSGGESDEGRRPATLGRGPGGGPSACVASGARARAFPTNGVESWRNPDGHMSPLRYQVPDLRTPNSAAGSGKGAGGCGRRSSTAGGPLWSFCKRMRKDRLLDPLTKLPLRDEVSPSALLCLYHQAERISWNGVTPLLPCTQRRGAAALLPWLRLVTSGGVLETARGGVENGERSFPSRG